jgi:hypothetical protein
MTVAMTVGCGKCSWYESPGPAGLPRDQAEEEQKEKFW